MYQLTFEPRKPKPSTVKAAVLHYLQAHPEGRCRRDFASIDIYELANRIGELEADGWIIGKGKCERHNHRHPFTLYQL
jgi:hypothetical protein